MNNEITEMLDMFNIDRHKCKCCVEILFTVILV